MRMLLSYLRSRRRVLLFSALCALLFSVSFLLYHLPVEAVLYPAGLCLLLGGIALGWDFLQFRRRHKLLNGLRSITDSALDVLPEAENRIEADYQRIIGLLREEQRQIEGGMRRRYADMIDYYTVWAHQIKTPIASMQLSLQSEDSPLSRKLRLDLFHIEQYVEMVLTYLRLDSDETDYVIRECEVDDILKRSLKKFAPEFIARKLSLRYEPVEIRAVTDEKWLGFVIEQLLSNALKYTYEGGVTIESAERCVLCIRDTGIGIAPEDLPRIFERGFTGCNGRGERSSSGLGLYLCRRICTNLSHGITARSTPGVGTAIFIDLNQRRLDVE